jgi:hypothetical protein
LERGIITPPSTPIQTQATTPIAISTVEKQSKKKAAKLQKK